MKIKSILLLILFSTSLAFGQTNRLTEAHKNELMNKVVDILYDRYIFPDKTDTIINYLRAKQKTDKFKAISNPSTFARQVTRYLKTVSKDLHLWIGYNPAEAKSHQNRSYGTYLRKQAKIKNYGFQAITHLKGNVGYLNMTHCHNPRYAEQTLAHALRFLSNCEGLIIDLRQNRGGSIYAVNTLISYFYNTSPIHLHSFRLKYYDKTILTKQKLIGKALPKMPLYILTSKRTASAAEQIAYDLKHLKRATIIGETTLGTANMGIRQKLDNNLFMFVTTGEMTNIITRTNFEGKGVIPHIKTGQKKALITAHLTALKQIIKTCTQPTRKKKLGLIVEELEKNLGKTKSK